MGNCLSQINKTQNIPQGIPQGIPIVTPHYFQDISQCTQQASINPQYLTYPNSFNTPNVVILNNGYNHYDPGFGLAATNGFLTGMLFGELIDDF